MPKPVFVDELANAALDKAYIQAARQMFSQIQAITKAPGSQMQRALKELADEANQLEENGKRMQPDNVYLQKALDTHEQILKTTQTLISANDNAIQESGQAVAVPTVTAKVFRRITLLLVAQKIDPLSQQALKAYAEQTKAAGIVWNIPQALDFATNYVDSPAWVAKMDGWGAGYADLTRKTFTAGIEQGWGPNYTAAQMRRYAENIPQHAAENLTRTLQLTSYRDASVAMEKANEQYIEKKIRIATLDDRTCLSCVALHGTELAPGERVDDHYRGRCSEFYVVPGGATRPDVMQADSKPGQRKFTQYQTGPEWFNSLPVSRQKQQASFKASPAKYRAFQDGVPLSDFVGEHQDPVFGRQTPERSLIDILGGEAAQYYQVNQ